jgi:hypothetical protein
MSHLIPCGPGLAGRKQEGRADARFARARHFLAMKGLLSGHDVD